MVGDAVAAVVYTIGTVPITATAISLHTVTLASAISFTSFGGKATAVNPTQELEVFGKESSEGGLWHVGRGDRT